jgi:transcriptional regulator with XRE-family HTH domain
MNPRPSQLIPELGANPEIDAAFARRYPYAGIALSVARLRARLGLTQAEFGARLGTTQSVVARLESGRHGFQISLLNRIAKAFGADWSVSFGAPEEAADELPAVEASGDALLDEFNAANTASDTKLARRVALRIAREPSTARRKLAVALDAINHAEYKKALEWAREASSLGLNDRSAGVARIVEGRALLGLKRHQEALDRLEGVSDQLALVTRLETLIELDRAEEAVAVGELLLGEASDRSMPLAAYSAARAYWHANRPYKALDQVTTYRASDPEERIGLMLHGAILGHIGDMSGKTEPYELAMQLFARLSDEEPESWRLRAMTAARLGDWRQALSAISRFVSVGSERPVERASVSRLVIECLDRVPDPAALDKALDIVQHEGLVDPAELRKRRSLACAWRGDFSGAVRAIGFTIATLEKADPEDQVRCASALLVSNEIKRAYPVLSRNRQALALPDGLRFLARAALENNQLGEAEAALKEIADTCQGEAGTRIALDLLQAIRRSHEIKRVLDVLSQSHDRAEPNRVVVQVHGTTAPGSSWEKPALPSHASRHSEQIEQMNRLAVQYVGAINN